MASKRSVAISGRTWAVARSTDTISADEETVENSSLEPSGETTGKPRDSVPLVIAYRSSDLVSAIHNCVTPSGGETPSTTCRLSGIQEKLGVPLNAASVVKILLGGCAGSGGKGISHAASRRRAPFR